MFRPVTKMAVKVTRADRIPEMLHAALRLAMTGRRGPVFLEIPRDVLNDRLPAAATSEPGRYRATHASPANPEAIREAAHLVRRAERPLLLVGGGANWAGAADAVVRLSDQGAIPMITAYGRNDAVPNSHPLYIGPLGRAGSPEAAAACRRADLLLVVGSRLGQFTSHFDDRYIRPGTPIVQIDIHGGDIGRYYPVAVGIEADAREACIALVRGPRAARAIAAARRRGARKRRRCAPSARRASRATADSMPIP